MKLLFLSQVLPYPLDAGPKFRSYYVLRYLAQRHRITLVAFTRATDSQEALAHLSQFCESVVPIPLQRSRARDVLDFVRSLVFNRSFLITRDDLAEMDAALARLTQLNHFDAIHADQLSMAHYARRLPVLQRVFDAHNAMWVLLERLAENEPSPFKRIFLRREARLMRSHEARTCAEFDRVITVTDEDRRALTFGVPPPCAPLITIPICIDPSEIQPIPFNPNAADVICVGGMFYPPNVDGVLWFARKVLPLIWATYPTMRFYIVGSRPAAELQSLGEGEPRIVVTGYVPDVKEYLSRAAAFVVPLRTGGGMRVKILDAWAWGLPIVSTTIGAEGIRVRADENLLLADSPGEFAAAVMRLVQNRSFAHHLAENGRSWVAAQYDWRLVYRAFDEIYPS